jgi:hypothetical protein
MQNVTQTVFSTFSEAASAAPIVLFRSKNPQEEGSSIYLQTKNTFLDFYTDENKQVRRSACSRSFSHDSILRTRAENQATPTIECSDSGSSTPCSHSKSGSTQFPGSNESGVDSFPECDDGPATPTWEVESSQSPMLQQYYNPQDTWMPEDDLQVIPTYDDMAWPPLEDDSALHHYALHEPAPHATLPQEHWQQPQQRRNASDQFNANFTNGICKSHSKKKQDLKKLSPPPEDYSGITTLMIRGIPCSFTQEDLLSIVDNAGLKGKYNFFYMPKGGSTGSNLGYVFINFTETIHAWTCAFTFNGIKLNPSRSTKVCTVSPADIQGVPSLRKHFRRTVVNRGPNGPIFFRQQRELKEEHRYPQGSAILRRQHTA